MDHADWTTTGALGDRYVLRSRVGSGRTNTVYVAEDVRLEREVALKLFHDLPDDDGLTRFATEARVLAGLSHPALVTVYDVNLTVDRPYMVMRLIDGGPLSAIVEHEGLAPATVARLGAQLAEVLAYVHERGVVHGDLDATNVLVDTQGDAHLTGFGADRGLGTVAGDVHALGMTLAECLPFELGGEWRTVLMMMTDPDPDARPDAARSAEILRNIAAGDTTDIPLPRIEDEPAPVAPPPTKKKPERRIRPAYAGLTGMGLAVSALAVVLATTPADNPRQPSGGQQQPPAEQQTDQNLPQPPGQSYPQAPGQEKAPARRQPEQRKPRPGEQEPPEQSAPAPPPPDGGQDEDSPGNGNGQGPGENNGNGPDRDRGLLGSILDGLG